jgi:FKBP12-rapamycin complex-associated protein
LTIWFDSGHEGPVEAELRRAFNLINIDTWLLVIPQIIARIHAAQPAVRDMIYEVLCLPARRSTPFPCPHPLH